MCASRVPRLSREHKSETEPSREVSDTYGGIRSAAGVPYIASMAYLDEAIARARARRNLPDPRTRRALREAVGLTQLDVALVLGVGRVQVVRYESGERNPRPEVAERYADLLDRCRQEIT
jgi:DNA-binding XRE family transcriptional regulator